MAQEKGFVNENLEAVLNIELSNGSTIDCVLDTGFNGTLIVPREFTDRNAIIPFSRVQVDLVEDKTAEIDVASTEVKWFAGEISINILISETGEALLGTQMLVDSILEIDYKNRSVKITK